MSAEPISCPRCEGEGSYSRSADCTTMGRDCACNGPSVTVDPCDGCGGDGESLNARCACGHMLSEHPRASLVAACERCHCVHFEAGGVTRYATIVADPPWDHSDGTGYVVTIGDRKTRRQRTDGGYVTGVPYGVSSLDAIKALPVAALAAPDAHLYLWTTNRYLRDVWDVAEAWGFRGVCILTWCKPPTGVMPGGAWGSNTEFCLFARRGSLLAVGQAKSRWYEWARRRGPSVREGERRTTMHSAKPDAFLDLVEQVSPGPYVELFARRARYGWDYWGDQSLGTASMEPAA